jgi:hypothetical protein
MCHRQHARNRGIVHEGKRHRPGGSWKNWHTAAKEEINDPSGVTGTGPKHHSGIEDDNVQSYCRILEGEPFTGDFGSVVSAVDVRRRTDAFVNYHSGLTGDGVHSRNVHDSLR